MGFVAIHDAFFDGWVWKLPAAQTKVLLYCIRRARWKKGPPSKWWNGAEFIEIPRGSFLGSIRTVAVACGVSPKQARAAIASGQANGTLKVTHKGKQLSLITLCNYDRYQDVQADQGTLKGTVQGGKRATLGHIEEPRYQEPKEKEREAPGLLTSSELTPRLPWQERIPWILKNLHRFGEVQEPKAFASKLLSRCLDEIGIRWPDLEEALLDSSRYLESCKPNKYKDIRRFYWNQTKLYKPSVLPDNNHDRTAPTRKPPHGWTRLENGIYYGSDGKPLGTKSILAGDNIPRLGDLLQNLPKKNL